MCIHNSYIYILFTDIPGTLSMTIDDDVVSCGDDVFVKNTLPIISCTISEAYPEPTLTLLKEGQNMTQSTGPMLNNRNCQYMFYLTIHSETHVTNGNKQLITCMSEQESCSITLEKGKVTFNLNLAHLYLMSDQLMQIYIGFVLFLVNGRHYLIINIIESNYNSI